MSSPLDRPARPPRNLPRPAADEGTDPIDYRSPRAPAAAAAAAALPGAPAAAPAPPAAPAAAAAAATPPRRREATVQLGTRVSIDVSDIIDAAHARTGRSKRELVEQAIRQAHWD